MPRGIRHSNSRPTSIGGAKKKDAVPHLAAIARQAGGRSLRLKPIDTGAYRIVSEPGSFYDAVIGVGTGPIRTAIRANLVFIRPLSRGDHVIEAEVHFAEGGGDFSASYLIHVRGTDDD